MERGVQGLGEMGWGVQGILCPGKGLLSVRKGGTGGWQMQEWGSRAPMAKEKGGAGGWDRRDGWEKVVLVPDMGVQGRGSL